VPQHPGVAHSHPSVSGAVPLLQSEVPVLHVYEHVVPLQESADAFVGVHTLPHALQLLVVLSSVQVAPHRVSLHVHEPALQSGAGWVQVAWFVHVPIALQVCGVFPLQFFWPGAHTPEHTPM